MKATGVIRIEGHLATNGAGCICAEREDGRSFGDFLPTNTGKSFLYELPLTDANLVLAGSFWKIRGWKVSVEYYPVVNPFPDTEYLVWKEQDEKNQVAEEKKKKILESDLAKLVKARPGLDSTFQEEFNRWTALRGEAEAKRLPAPDKTEGVVKANAALVASQETEKKIREEIATLERGILK